MWIYNVIIMACIIFLLFQYYKSRRGIAYIDSLKIYNGYKGITQAKAEFQKKGEFYKTRIDTLSGRVKLSMMKMEEAKDDKQKYFSALDSVRFYKKQLNDYQVSMTESLKKDESDLTQKAMIKLNEFLKEYGKSHGYEMILIANPSGTIAFAKDEYDITDEILKEANEAP